MPGEKHRTEVTEATEGDLGLVGLEVLLVNTEASVREFRAGEKHRTEVTSTRTVLEILQLLNSSLLSPVSCLLN
jgi:hypothetical protein